MSRVCIRTLLVSIVVTLLASATFAEEKKPLDNETLLAIESALARHDVERAEALVNDHAIPPKIRPRLLGALRFEQGRYAEAIPLFERALDDKPEDSFNVYLAAALTEVGRPAEALKRLPRESKVFKSSLPARLVVGRALRESGQRQEAFDVFTKAATDFAPAPAPLVEAIVIASEEGLPHLTQALVETLLETEGVTSEHRRLAALALAPEPSALVLLETIAAIENASVDVAMALGSSYAAAELPRAAAQAYARASAHQASGIYAADQWATAGDLKRALTANAQVDDDKQRLQQRVRLLFSHGEMARVVALEAQLRAAAALDDAARYQLAYAHYRLQQPASAIEWARSLDDSPGYAGAAAAILDALGAAGAAAERE